MNIEIREYEHSIVINAGEQEFFFNKNEEMSGLVTLFEFLGYPVTYEEVY